MARRDPGDRVSCNDWEAFREAVNRGRKLAYESDGKQVHVWREDNPRSGDRCECGAWTWT